MAKRNNDKVFSEGRVPYPVQLDFSFTSSTGGTNDDAQCIGTVTDIDGNALTGPRTIFIMCGTSATDPEIVSTAADGGIETCETTAKGGVHEIVSGKSALLSTETDGTVNFTVDHATAVSFYIWFDDMCGGGLRYAGTATTAAD
jgi:hypothetical protein